MRYQEADCIFHAICICTHLGDFCTCPIRIPRKFTLLIIPDSSKSNIKKICIWFCIMDSFLDFLDLATHTTKTVDTADATRIILEVENPRFTRVLWLGTGSIHGDPLIETMKIVSKLAMSPPFRMLKPYLGGQCSW